MAALFANMFATIAAAMGETVTVWSANAPDNATAGIDDAAWVSSGTMTAIVNEMIPKEAVSIAGGLVGTKLAMVFTDATDGATIGLDNLIVTAEGKVWRVVGEPSQPANGGHYEALCSYESNPPSEVLP